MVARDALGREVTGAPIVLKPSVAGQGIMLTIDATIQYLAEKEVDAAWRRTRAKSAMAVVMDPRTGEILAMAIRPTYNPNAFATATDDDRRARAVTDPFEPGSTFKVIMAAAALEEGVVRPTDRIYGENGAITIATRPSTTGRSTAGSPSPRCSRTPRTWARSRWGCSSARSATTST